MHVENTFLSEIAAVVETGIQDALSVNFLFWAFCSANLFKIMGKRKPILEMMQNHNSTTNLKKWHEIFVGSNFRNFLDFFPSAQI